MKKDFFDKWSTTVSCTLGTMIAVVLIVALFVPAVSERLGSFNTWVMLPILIVMALLTVLQNKKNEKLKEETLHKKNLTKNIIEETKHIMSSHLEYLNKVLVIAKEGIANGTINPIVKEKITESLRENKETMEKLDKFKADN